MKNVLITGATGGIGLEFTRLFAAKGYNLVLVARNADRLQEMAAEFTTLGIDVHLYAEDLSVVENAARIYADLRTRGIAIDYLINNAGFGIDAPYVDIQWEKEQQMFNLNMMTLAYFTKVFAKDMASRHFGRILNVSSVAAFQPGPYMAGYCATKTFVLSLSQAVNYELKGSGVTVTALCPGVTDSRFHVVAGTEEVGMSKYLSHASSAEVADYGYKLMMRGRTLGVQGIMNKCMVFSNRFVPRSLSTLISAMMLRKNKD